MDLFAFAALKSAHFYQVRWQPSHQEHRTTVNDAVSDKNKKEVKSFNENTAGNTH